MPWAPVQSARKGMGPSHLPSKLMESIGLTLALPSGRGAGDFSTNAVRCRLVKRSDLSLRLQKFHRSDGLGRTYGFFLKEILECLKIS